MKRRLFFRSLAGTIASLALAQSIVCAKLQGFAGRPAIGYTLKTHILRQIRSGDSIAIATGEGEQTEWFATGARRLMKHGDYIIAENFDGTSETVCVLPREEEGLTYDFQTVFA